jgi:uncharacterized protein YegL
MKKDLTELVFILDKSGSMSGLEKDTIGGFNSLIEKQKNESGEAIVSTVLFSDKMDVIHDRIDIKDVPKLTSKEYFVSGCTALLDTVGFSINHIKHVQENLSDDEKPEKTLFIITTDGMENSSHEFNYQKIKKLIDEVKEKNKYEFIFLGANIDSEEEAAKLGIDKDQAVSYKNDESGVQLNYCALGDAITGLRREKKLSKAWRESIDADVKKRGK